MKSYFGLFESSTFYPEFCKGKVWFKIADDLKNGDIMVEFTGYFQKGNRRLFKVIIDKIENGFIYHGTIDDFSQKNGFFSPRSPRPIVKDISFKAETRNRDGNLEIAGFYTSINSNDKGVFYLKPDKITEKFKEVNTQNCTIL
jgi:hypothetical protein